MIIKYTIPYRDFANTAWRVDIALQSWTEDAFVLTGVGQSACSIEWSPTETDDPFCPTIGSTATISFYDENHVVDVSELQNAQDTDFTVYVYRDNELYWVGYLIPDGVQNPLKAVPQLNISCTDGLSLLDDMIYDHDNLPGLDATGIRIPMNYIRQILFSPKNLGLMLPIDWTNSLQCTAFNNDMFVGDLTGAVIWSARGEGYTSYQLNGETKTCGYILWGILKSAQCNIKQVAGRWVIRRIPDIVTGIFSNTHIDASLGIMGPVTSTIDINKVIGATGYRFMNEDQVTTVRKGVKLCRTTYEANVRENILPNGNMDIESLGTPIYWNATGDTVFVSTGGIDGREGSAVELTNITGGAAYDIFGLSDGGSPLLTSGLPIDAYTLVKRISFGFIFSPILGFPVDPVSGIIDFSSNPFEIQITLFMGGSTIYYLDEFAIWRTTPTFISISVEGLKLNDVAQVDFNRNNAIIIPIPSAPLDAGDKCELSVFFKVKDGQQYDLDYVHFTIDENNDVYEAAYNSENTAIDERTLEISSSFGGYMLSNYMSVWNRSDEECFYNDGSFYTGNLTGVNSQAIMRFLYKSSVIYNGSMYIADSKWTMDEVYTIDTLTGKFIPLNATYNTETCEVQIVAIECRNDDISLTEKHYGSNDQQLSN